MDSRQLLAMLAAAQSLRSEDGENPEYDRGMCELIAYVAADVTRFEVAGALGIALKRDDLTTKEGTQ